MNKNIDRIFVIFIFSCIVFCSVGSGILISTYNEQMKMPYYEGIYINDGFERWDKPLVNITASGDMSPNDWYCIEDVINEWNNKIEYPKIGYNNQYPDIEIMFDKYPDESWAGCAWVSHDGKKITHGYIKIRTSWPFNREHVIRHELGHIMGLCYHSNHPNSTMYGSAIGVSEWSQEDIQVINALYSKPIGTYFGY